MPHNSTYFHEFHNYVDKYRNYEHVPVDELFWEVINACDYLETEEIELIHKAFEIANQAHHCQVRKSGVPYITHPLIICLMMMPYRPSGRLIAATLLHDTIEDTMVTSGDLSRLDEGVKNIVEWATKIRNESGEDASWLSDEQAKFETIRKILVASQKISIYFF